MRRPVTFAGIALVAALAFGLYKLKYEVQELEARSAAIQRAILSEQEAIRVLKAEWSFLNNPKRLAELAQRYLELGPLGAGRVVRLEQIPIDPARASDARDERNRPSARPTREGGN